MRGTIYDRINRILAIHLEGKRFYPGGRLLCHLVGMTGTDNKGLEGIEFYYDRELAGEVGWRRSYRDAKRREIKSFHMDALPERNGINLALTIDEVIQHIIEKEIENIVASYSPRAVSIVAMAPRTGEILGLANYPWFDPNNVSDINPDHVRNRAISDSFEPGSVFKIVTAAAALEEGVVDFDSEFFCENGAYRIGKRTLHDYKPFGMMKFREIIEKSSNIGVFKVADKLGKEKMHAYIKKFNFGRPTGIDLPGEASGITRDVANWSAADMTTIPMGHGIAVTPLQLASCVSAIANGGVLMRPYVVKSLLSEEGMSIKENKPKAVRRVISEETAAKVKELLEGVVERGTGKKAGIDNFRVCGKTGTAEKVNTERGGYYRNRYITSFVGFAPFERPAVSVVISVDEPKGEHLASRVGAPAFKNIMQKILSYMEIEGDKSET
jgi:cell division protein FtsI/penicillin-binding protein 2